MIAKFSQNGPLHSAALTFDPDSNSVPALALRLNLANVADETPIHQHRKGQLVIALHGGVICRTGGLWWMAPPQSGVWIPGGVAHSNKATANAKLCCLFVEPGAADLPDKCCTLTVGPMLREMILRLAECPSGYEPGTYMERIARLTLEELALMPIEQLSLPISGHPKIRQMANTLIDNPADRTTLPQWAERLAVSERSMSRLMFQETGLSFGRWRQQLQLIVALRELAEGHSVQQVSADLGYNSATAFTTMFRKAMGQSPAKYFNDRMKKPLGGS
jgi:AraC-like DNA-binding protein